MRDPSSSLRFFRAALAFLAFASPLAASAQPAGEGDTTYRHLGRLIDQRAGEMDWEGGELAYMVMDLQYGVPVASREPDSPMRPGGVQKLLLLPAALDLLGPDFRFATELHVEGVVEKRFLKKGVLRGNLLVRGGGDPGPSAEGLTDPERVYEVFDRWAEKLRALKIRRVEGGIGVEDSAFDSRRAAPGWPADLSGEAWLPEVSALNFNGNCVEVFLKGASKAGRPAGAGLLPHLPDYVFFSSNVRTGGPREIPRQYRRKPGSNVINAAGSLPPKAEVRERASIHDPALFYGNALKARLAVKGIEVEGKVARRRIREPEAGPLVPGNDLATTGTAPAVPLPPPEKFDEALSPPLKEILAEMLRLDRTLDAEAVLKTIGARETGLPGSFEAGLRAVIARLARARVSPAGLVMLDGSGASALASCSPRHLMAALKHFQERPDRDLILGLLPLAGTPGVLEKRFAREAAVPEAEAEAAAPGTVIRAAAGRFEGGATLAGWAMTRARHPVHFVFMVQGSKLAPAELERRIDSLVLAITRSALKPAGGG